MCSLKLTFWRAVVVVYTYPQFGGGVLVWAVGTVRVFSCSWSIAGTREPKVNRRIWLSETRWRTTNGP